MLFRKIVIRCQKINVPVTGYPIAPYEHSHEPAPIMKIPLGERMIEIRIIIEILTIKRILIEIGGGG